MYYQYDSFYTNGHFYKKLVIQSYPDNQLIFYSNEGYLLNTTENNLKPVITLYPNPVTDELFIHHQNEGEIKGSLYNLTGQLLLQEVFNHNNNQLSLKELPSGTYFLMIETQEGQKEVKKVVKK